MHSFPTVPSHIASFFACSVSVLNFVVRTKFFCSQSHSNLNRGKLVGHNNYLIYSKFYRHFRFWLLGNEKQAKIFVVYYTCELVSAVF